MCVRVCVCVCACVCVCVCVCGMCVCVWYVHLAVVDCSCLVPLHEIIMTLWDTKTNNLEIHAIDHCNCTFLCLLVLIVDARM